MDSQYLKKLGLPDEPGVYIFSAYGRSTEGGKNSSGILYIGKATSLRDRVKSYFANDLLATRSPLIADMVFKAKNLEFIQTDSVLEALILEANLIKKHQPKYNTKEKDDKSYNYIVITKEDFPRVLIERGKNINFEKLEANGFIKIKAFFGPFTNTTQLKEALKIVRRIFPFRDYCRVCESAINECKPCFNYQLGLCPGPCIGAISKKEYAKNIKNIKLFFEGKKTTIMKNLKREIAEHVTEQEFEKAGESQKKIFALSHIQDIALLKKENTTYSGVLANTRIFRIEAYDIAHISGTNTVGVMTVIENGKINTNEYRKFNIAENIAGDVPALREVLERRLNHDEWRMPDLIVMDGSVAQKNIAEHIVREFGKEIPVVAVTKNEQHRPKIIQGREDLIERHKNEILLANSEAHRFAIGFHRQKSRKSLFK